MSVSSKNYKYLFWDEAPAPIEVTGAKGNYLFEGKKRYLDFMMGWNVGNIGWNNEAVMKVIRDFDGPNYVTPDYMYRPWGDLAKLIASVAPGNLKISMRATGGTEAVEIALQTAMVHTKRTGFVSIEGSYHGHSIGAMSVGRSSWRKHWTNLLPNCYKVNAPLDGDAARKIEKIIKTEKIAAFIAEPIVCNLGVEIPTKEFYQIVSEACKTYNTLMIMDEVATGFGRTGKMFASEHYNLKPDLMTLGKGMSGGYSGIGATIATPEVADSMRFYFSAYSTYGWTPIATAATTANIKYIIKNKLLPESVTNASATVNSIPPVIKIT